MLEGVAGPAIAMRPNWFVGWTIDAPGVMDRLACPPERVRLFVPSDLHITLAFFGSVDAERARAAFSLVNPADFRAISVVPTSLSLMGHPKRGTALAADIGQGRATLIDGMSRYRDALLNKAGTALPQVDHRPHVTVARIGRRARDPQRSAALTWARAVDLDGLVFHVDRIGLYTWAKDRRNRLFQLDRAMPLPS